MKCNVYDDGNIVLTASGPNEADDEGHFWRYAGNIVRPEVAWRDGNPQRILFVPTGRPLSAIKAAPPLDDLRDVLDWMHTEVATSSQAGIIEPRDRDKLLALAGRVEAWLVEQGEAR